MPPSKSRQSGALIAASRHFGRSCLRRYVMRAFYKVVNNNQLQDYIDAWNEQDIDSSWAQSSLLHN
jgi:hypothetical protein